MSNAAPISDDELTTLFAGLEATPLALAVSGGEDSMALMHMVARWAKREEVRAAYQERWHQALTPHADDAPPREMDWTGLARPPWLQNIDTVDDLRRAGGTPHAVVLTIDHGLRLASADEARFVCDEAAKLGLPCVALRWEGEKPSTGIQEAARNVRRDLMCDALCAERGTLSDMARAARLGGGSYLYYRRLVMAHHQEDQAETFLMRLARGSGLEGLGGMRPHDVVIRAATAERRQSFEAAVVRPLLDVPKARLVATLEAYGVRWVEDPSNEDERFERVRVRKALAQLSEVGLSAEKIALSARRLRDAEIAVLRLLHSEGMERATDAASAVCIEADLNSADFVSVYTGARVLRRILDAYGGSARAAELAQLEQLARKTRRIRERAEIASLTLGGCKIELVGEPGAWRLRIYREGSGEGLPVLPIAPGQSVDWDGRRFTVCAQTFARQRAVIRALGMQGWVEVKRLVPGLAKLGLPAAAVATLPVVADAETGQVISYSALDGVLRHMRGPQGDNLGEAVPTPVWEEWQASGLTGGEYHIMFKGLAGTW